MPKRELDDVARMTDEELDRALTTALRARGAADFSTEISEAHWLIESMWRRGFQVECYNMAGWEVSFDSRRRINPYVYACSLCHVDDLRKLPFPRAVSEAALRALRARAAAKKERRNG